MGWGNVRQWGSAGLLYGLPDSCFSPDDLAQATTQLGVLWGQAGMYSCGCCTHSK